MRWIYTLLLFIICTTYTACDVKTVAELFESCIYGYTTYGFMDIYYLSVDPFSYKKLDSIRIHRSLRYNVFTSHEPDFETDSLLKAGCICTKMDINSHEFIVMPLMIDGLMSDALVLCIFRDPYTSITSVLDVPTDKLQHYMMAQYMAKMPRSLVNFENETDSDCINLRGQPSSFIPGQRMCFYYSYAMYKNINDYYEIEQEKRDFGPFLGTQLPDFKYLSKATTVTSLVHFTTQLAQFCALVKNNSRINPILYQPEPPCFFQTHRNPPYLLEFITCCCIRYDSANCKEHAMASISNDQVYCRHGTYDKADAKFGKFCAARVVQNYAAVLNQENGFIVNLEHVLANSDEKIYARYLSVNKCDPSVIITCDHGQVRVIQTTCCNDAAFCNSHQGANMLIKRCYLSFAEDFKTAGCAIVFYHDEKDGKKKWNIVSPAWFDMTKSKLVHLYSSTYTTDETTSYNISIGFMVAHRSHPNCNSEKPRPNQMYFVLNCYRNTFCDTNFNEAFFKTLDEKIILDSLEQSNITKCEKGEISIPMPDDSLTKLPIEPNTTLKYGLYCELRVTLDQQNGLKITFGPVSLKSDECDERLKLDDESFVCCYEASSDPSFINPECHYSTVLEKMKQLTDRIKEEKNKANSLARFGIHEHFDDCEQRIAGRFGGSRHCAPGGVGCFHLLRMDLSKKEVVASCIGYAENMIASNQEYYDNFGEALICLTPESQDSCQYVYEGPHLYLLCCCQADEVYNHVAQCAEDSKTMFHESSQALKKVGEFAEPSQDDEKH